MMRLKIFLLILLIPAGIGTKYYSGPASDFMHHYAGGFIYVYPPDQPIFSINWAMKKVCF